MIKLLTEDFDPVINEGNITISLSIKELNTIFTGVGCNSFNAMKEIADRYKLEVLTNEEVDEFYPILKEITLKFK